MTNQTDFIRTTFPVGPLQCNCTIIGDKATGKAIVVDPGGDADTILAKLNELGLKGGCPDSYPCSPGSFPGQW